jgi:AraC family transcriptional regulator
MDLLDRMNLAIDYAEQHITDDIDLPKLAQLTCCSTYNFQRMFSMVTGITIVEYVRRRRLTLAALDLQQGNIKVIDVALKYGYDSPISFARAFQTLHGITPSEAKRSNMSLKAFPKMTFQITIQGVSEMNYRIVKTKPFKVFGLEEVVSTIGENYFQHGGKIWRTIWDTNFINGKYEQLKIAAGEEHPSDYDTMFTGEMWQVHALMNYKKINDTTYGYMQCSFVAPDSKTEGYTVVEIPEMTWAVFPTGLMDWEDVGSAIDELFKKFYSEWLPISEYEKVDGPEFEMHSGTLEEGNIELWMPVRKK